MTEGEFIKFYKERNKTKNYKETKEKIELFWDALLKALNEDGKVVLKNWGVFQIKEVKPRKIVILKINKSAYTVSKKVIKFKAGLGLQDAVARVDINE